MLDKSKTSSSIAFVTMLNRLPSSKPPEISNRAKTHIGNLNATLPNKQIVNETENWVRKQGLFINEQVKLAAAAASIQETILDKNSAPKLAQFLIPLNPTEHEHKIDMKILAGLFESEAEQNI